MLWFQKDSLDTVGFRTSRTLGGGGGGGVSEFLNKIVDFGEQK